jgi:hypothetical protein
VESSKLTKCSFKGCREKHIVHNYSKRKVWVCPHHRRVDVLSSLFSRNVIIREGV